MNDAAVAPAPGSTPTNVPRKPERSAGGRSRLKSCLVIIDPRRVSFSVAILTFGKRSSIRIMTWEKPTIPITKGVKGIPPSRYSLPKS